MLMVLLDINFDALEIYEADRSADGGALIAPGSKSRNERGHLASPTSRVLAIAVGLAVAFDARWRVNHLLTGH